MSTDDCPICNWLEEFVRDEISVSDIEWGVVTLAMVCRDGTAERFLELLCDRHAEIMEEIEAASEEEVGGNETTH